MTKLTPETALLLSKSPTTRKAAGGQQQTETQDEIEAERLAYLREVWADENATAAHADDLVSGDDDFSRQMRSRHEIRHDEPSPRKWWHYFVGK